MVKPLTTWKNVKWRSISTCRLFVNSTMATYTPVYFDKVQLYNDL